MNLQDHEPQVIVLNGPSSTGKTSLAKALIERTPSVYVFRDLGVFCGLVSSRVREDFNLVKRIMLATNRSIVALGYGVILEVIAKSVSEWNDLLSSYAEYRVLTVGVSASPEVCDRRETIRVTRGERFLGLSRKTRTAIPSELGYDLQLDSSTMNPEELAQVVITHVNGRNQRPTTDGRVLGFRQVESDDLILVQTGAVPRVGRGSGGPVRR